ncbi:MAG: O-antigen ligase family protein [Bacteroidales bacterium]|nr:O-antigen ligase family protein [Bacteroidales bacterium]
MIDNSFNLDKTDTYISIYDKIIEILLFILLAFMPLAFGAVEAWSEEVVVIITSAIAICFILKLIFEEHASIMWSWIYVPIVLFILVVIFQLIPLPMNLVKTISPNTVLIKQELLADLPDSENLLNYMTLSFYPNATKHDLRIILSLSIVFFVFINIYRHPIQIKRLLAAIAIIGGSIALLALAQDIIGNGRIFWKIPTAESKAFSGTFVNHSHYGQFMNLSIGAALGLIFIKLHEKYKRKKVTAEKVFEYLSSPSSLPIWLLLFMIIIGVVTVFVSLTRGGMISMFIATGFVIIVIGSRKSLKRHGWIIALIALCSFTCILYIGFDSVYDRLASLQNLNQAESGRLQILKDIALAWTKFPVFGTGLGTHEVVYPMFDRSTIARLAAYAENEYAQTAEETGLVGLLSLAVFGVFICIYYIRNIKNTSSPVQSAAYGLGFGLVAILIHSLSDFGQHLPANSFLSVISCALLLVLAKMGTENHLKAKAIAFNPPRYISIAILICIAGLSGWNILHANNARLAESHWKQAVAIEQDLIEKNWQASDEEYISLLKNASQAAKYQPDNVKYQHWLNVYRWESISRIKDPNTGEVFLTAQTLEFVDRIVSELHKASLLCPTYGATYCVVGQLEKFTLENPEGKKYIQKGFQLAPCDPTACFVSGMLDIEEQNIEASFEKFNRAVQLDEKYFQNVADIYINHVNRPKLAIALAADNTNRLSYIANAITENEEYTEIAKEVQLQITELLKEKCAGPDVTASALASLANIFRKENNYEQAIEHYRRALSMEYNQVYWRYALARLLADTGKVAEAIHEADICLRLSPGFEAAKRLIDELSVVPVSMEDDN